MNGYGKRICLALGALLAIIILGLLSGLILYIFITSNIERKAKDVVAFLQNTNQITNSRNSSWQSEMLVEWLNMDPTNSWTARLNTHAIGYVINTLWKKLQLSIYFKIIFIKS